MHSTPFAWESYRATPSFRKANARSHILRTYRLLLGGVSVVSARATGRGMTEFFAVGLVMALVTGGVTYALSQWFAQLLIAAGSG